MNEMKVSKPKSPKEDIQVKKEVGTQEDLAKLYKKVANVMGEVGMVEKNGYNNYYNYEYATAEDIKEAIRPLCAKESLWISSQVKDYKKNRVKTSKGSSTEIELTMYFTIRCGDTGAKVRLVYSGYSIDSSDKFIYKAYTGAMKYFLINNFMLSTGDDPEVDSPEIQDNEEEKNPKPEPEEASLIDEIKNYWKNKGDIVEDVAIKFLKEKEKGKDISAINTLSDDELEELIERIEEKI